MRRGSKTLRATIRRLRGVAGFFARGVRSVGCPGVEDHEGLGACDSAATAEEVDDAGEVFDVFDADPDEGVRVAGGCEHGEHFGQLVGDGGDVGDLGVAGEAQFGECLELSAELCVVDDGPVPGDHTVGLEAVDAALDGRDREVDGRSEVGEALAGVAPQQIDESVIDRIEVSHANSISKCAG